MGFLVWSHLVGTGRDGLFVGGARGMGALFEPDRRLTISSLDLVNG